MTQQQIDTMTGILEGREFTLEGFTYIFGRHGFVNVGLDFPVHMKLRADHFLNDLLLGNIQLVPQPPEPLSDEMGELLWLLAKGVKPPLRRTSRLFDLMEANGGGLNRTGKYLLGEYLMRVNKEAV